MNKSLLRKKYSDLRAAMTSEEIEEKSIMIANMALSLPIWNYTYYHIFMPIEGKNEVNTENLLHILQGKDKSIVIPKANFKTGEMSHILLQENTALYISDYGIPEPVSGIELSPTQIEVVFVPLLAYDQDGNRIGYGKGFYDRFLSQCKETTVFVGLSFFEPESEIASELNDIPLHFCVTPKKTYQF
ncbi:5-formyltetrahydrofolate cyclo-ligase [Ulvibacter antarcticus]|uniref:5-formyltetrahydrofolate cyclo-ligase n=1 Tax=Ulvibacter antarcticus TaxID=442714 RepID=A0A3L9Z356_9FLAO|nr:5-formyltetrahydrofolate cyclo-ligase [Ulvibacter antarcticus]RMA65859.1 5-formyltetrahydrofolate cyclo-ligase [Ulvibacter antarcticus]